MSSQPRVSSRVLRISSGYTRALSFTTLVFYVDVVLLAATESTTPVMITCRCGQLDEEVDAAAAVGSASTDPSMGHFS